MDNLKKYIFAIVKELQDKRVSEHKAPVNVSLTDISSRAMADIKTALNGFVKSGQMGWHTNVNGIPMFEIKDNKTE